MAQAKKPVAKTTAEDSVNRAIPTNIAAKRYTHGTSAYNPRAPHNMAAYEKMCKLLDADKAGKGVPGDKLAALLTVNGKHPNKTHFDFIGYLAKNNQLTEI